MTNITLDGLPAKTGTVSDAGIIHFREGGVDKKMTVADFLIRISEEYSSDINTFLATADKAAGRAALDIARRTTVSNDDYTILATDKVVAQIGTMSAPRAFTLPTAASYPAGEELIIIDQSGTVTATNKITVSRVSADTIDGLTSANIEGAYGILRLISDGTSKWKVSNSYIQATESVAGIALLPKQITIANNGTDANNDIDFSAGNFQFSDGTGIATLSALTKQLDATWAAGTNQGGLFSGSKANSTWYHCFAIYNPTSDVVDCGFDTSVSAANIPSGYTKYYLVESILTNGSGNIAAFTHYANSGNVIWKDPVDDVSAASASSATLRTLSSPLGRKVNVFIKYWLSDAVGSGTISISGLISSPDQSDANPSGIQNADFTRNTNYYNENPYSGQIYTDTSSRVRTRVTSSGYTNDNILTIGWSK